jgi:PhnB protein
VRGAAQALEFYGALEDPFGHMWNVATHVEDVSKAEMRKRAQKMASAASGGVSDGG